MVPGGTGTIGAVWCGPVGSAPQQALGQFPQGATFLQFSIVSATFWVPSLP
jgi:hypothetical protein